MENVITQIDSQVTKELMAPAKRLYFIFGLIGLVSTAAIVVAINVLSGAAAVSMLLFVTGAMLIGGGGGWVVLIVAERRQNKRLVPAYTVTEINDDEITVTTFRGGTDMGKTRFGVKEFVLYRETEHYIAVYTQKNVGVVMQKDDKGEVAAFVKSLKIKRKLI